MKILLIIGLFVIGSHAHAQSLAEANSLFDRYEYAQAAEVYSQLAQKKSLSEEDYKKLAYSYFITGAYAKCLPLADSLVKITSIEPYFFYMHGMSAMATGDYSTAKQSFQKYQALDSEYPVTMLISSCDAIPSWEEEKHTAFTLLENNNTKADFTGTHYGEDFIRFQEIGKDSMGNLVSTENVDLAELLLSKPFIYRANGDIVPFRFDASLDNAVITSLAFFAPTNEVLVSISQPLEEEEFLKAPHLYKGQLDPATNSISNLVLWEYSGHEDSTICAHATVNASGNTVVFSKVGANTQGSDLYMSKLMDGSWSKPTPLISLNTEQDDVYPLFSGDSILSFSSDGRIGYGGLDIYVGKLSGEEVTNIHHLKAPINSFADDFNYTFISEEYAVFSSNRTGGKGDDDIYTISYEVEKVDHELEAFNNFVATWIDMKVYFDFAKYDFNSDESRLQEVVRFMEKYPNLTLSIEGHTDSRGTEEYNENLGFFRADVIKKEFVAKGIKPSQISIVSKGKTDPQMKCEKGCSEAEHKLNRVAIVKLVIPQ